MKDRIARVVIGSLAASCGGGGPISDAGVEQASDAAADAGQAGDAGGPTLFGELFGPNDALLPGRSCKLLREDCRGQHRMFVCENDAGEPVGEGVTCRACQDAADCEREYSYYAVWGIDIECGADGSCHPLSLEGEPLDGDTCDGVGYCITSRKGWFVCGTDDHCRRCTGTADCLQTYGCSWICGSSPTVTGVCLESLPPPPECN